MATELQRVVKSTEEWIEASKNAGLKTCGPIDIDDLRLLLSAARVMELVNMAMARQKRDLVSSTELQGGKKRSRWAYFGHGTERKGGQLWRLGTSGPPWFWGCCTWYRCDCSRRTFKERGLDRYVMSAEEAELRFPGSVKGGGKVNPRQGSAKLRVVK
jgi:hypothetical protein